MDNTYDAIIIGGGINGSSIAFQLAKRGRKVAVLERERLACKSSGAAAGILGAQTELTEDGPLFEFARKSRTMFPELVKELEELSGVPTGYQNKGMYKVAATEDQLLELKDLIEFQTRAGEKAEWLPNNELLKHEPNVSSSLLGAMYIPNDGQVDARGLSLAFAKAAMVLGAEFFEYTSVNDFILQGDKVIGVQTDQGPIHSEAVVAATGAWSKFLFEKTGLSIPISPVKGECFSAIAKKPLINGTVFSHGCYIVPKQSGRLVVGATMKPNTFDEKVTVSAISALMEKAQLLVPGIADAELERAWAGIRPLSDDGLPFLGEHPSYRGLYIAAGHFRNGILLSPATGELMADLLDGKVEDLGPFRLSRISGGIHA
ncbi:glycine oxidase ThiO [Mesobacillus boroniphilus]|uniref:Aerobic glycerol-3-phosphate dehydrogenase n=1 Tax=Mesobacillus boroniphilus TaxID=308892 RepID=A0A944GXK7_9BACI|nr:glycine oxidase ThiO [Mesobacillus boroniphilus]MBS8265867.1 glycine oxidase ThiO [Mesobacillus boroniphilus]